MPAVVTPTATQSPRLVVVVGGAQDKADYLADAECLDFAQATKRERIGEWQPFPSLAVARANFGFCVTDDGRLVAAGGLGWAAASSEPQQRSVVPSARVLGRRA
jgi:hypothetical protein